MYILYTVYIDKHVYICIYIGCSRKTETNKLLLGGEFSCVTKQACLPCDKAEMSAA